MFLVNFVARLISIIHSNISPRAIAAGFSLGMVIGLTPSLPINFIVVLILIIFNVNIAAALFSMAFFRLIAYLFDPLFHNLGYFLLTAPQPIRSFWIRLYNTPFIPFTGFNNTVVLGSLVVSLILFFPVLIQIQRGIIAYRQRYYEKVQQWKLIRYIRSSLYFQMYLRLKQFGDMLWR